MCDHNKTGRTQEYLRWGHMLPNKPCSHYSHKFKRCLANPYTSGVGGVVEVHTGSCKFCREGKNIEGPFAFGKG